MKMKQLNALVPEEIHRRLRISLAEDQMSFGYWLYRQIIFYLQKKGHINANNKKDNELVTFYINRAYQSVGRKKGR